jgi:Leucine-rich repeat (LRR) protein
MMDKLPDDIIRLIYSYLQNPKQIKYLNKNFCNIFTVEEAVYRIKNLILYNGINFNDLKNLYSLDCSYNELTILPDFLNNLTKLYCSGNQLTSLPDCLSNLKILFF